MKLVVNNIVMKLLGMLLLTAAVLKGHELLTTPMANADIWTNRYFMIFQVEFEIALGIWLLSGLFKRAAWLAALGCFTLFCGVALYKALAGFGSCGCFGNVHVNPWITLFSIDLPAVVLLLIFRPKLEIRRFLHIPHWLEPFPKRSVLVIVFLAGLTAVAVSSPVLILNEPAKVTAQYEVLEPETWVGKELPIWKHIDICEKLKTGQWIIVFYHFNCPPCVMEIPNYEKLASKMKKAGKDTRIALVSVPPHAPDGRQVASSNSDCYLGKLAESKSWLVNTPEVIVVNDGIVTKYIPGISYKAK